MGAWDMACNRSAALSLEEKRLVVAMAILATIIVIASFTSGIVASVKSIGHA